MKTWIRHYLEYIKFSFWFVPGLMVLGAMLLSFSAVALDKQLNLYTHDALRFLYSGGVDGARSILATIAGSMMTVAGVTFSITIVALTLASSQFGPRLLRNFMKDRGNQVVLGSFIATFIYCILVIRSVTTKETSDFVPDIAVTLAVIMSLINVGILIYFIHHVSVSIQADKVISRVYRDLLGHLENLFPTELGYESVENREQAADATAADASDSRRHGVAATASGYLQAIDDDGLMEYATRENLLVRLHFRPGEFITTGDIIATVECDEDIPENAAAGVEGALILGERRSAEQDAEFAVDQLVEIALRALSPGVNDPFTAISCIDWLGSALCFLTTREIPSPYRHDGDDVLRIVAKAVTFEGIMNAAFDQIRQCGRSNVAVMVRLMAALKKIAGHARTAEQRQAVMRQAKMILRASRESFPETNDKKDVSSHYQDLLECKKDGLTAYMEECG